MAALVRDPLYMQIVEVLLREISEGKYPRESRFPSERELAARFEISRTTANKVLSMLVAERRLQYRKGVGAFVSSRPLEHDMSALFSFTEKARREGIVPETKVLRFEDALHDELGETIYLERLRSADGVPVIFEKRHLVKAVCAGITREMAAGSLYEAMRKLGIEVSRAEQRARAVSPDTEERKLLQIRQGCACLRVEGRGYLPDGGIIWEEDTLFRGDRYEIHGILGPSGTSSGRIIQERG
jgi:GntR family transcriptional regulator